MTGKDWIPAFAGMTGKGWIPAFAGMTGKGWIPAFAGMTGLTMKTRQDCSFSSIPALQTHQHANTGEPEKYLKDRS